MFNFSKKKQEEPEINFQLEEQKCIIDGIKRSMAFIEFSLDGKIIDANDNFLNTVGYNKDEIIGNHHKIFCEPEYAESNDYKDFWSKLNNGEFIKGRFKRLSKSGDVIWLQATYTPIYDHQNKLSKVVKFASNVTENVEKALKERAKLESLNRSTAIIEFNPDGTIIDCNENFLATVKYKKEDVIGKHHRIFCDTEYTESSEYNDFWRRLNKGEFFSGQFKRVNSYGDTIWLEASYNPVYDEEGNLSRIVKFASDITEQTERSHKERESVKSAYSISNDTSKTAEEGARIINNAIEEMNKIAGSVRSSSEHIENLNQQSSDINSIVKTIQDIADQTNLLALNAAIEAARAGEQGRGFAVVADEVRTLAARTSESTSEISGMVTNIQTNTKNASTSMETCLNQVNLGVDLAHETGEAITRIQKSATEVVSAVDNLAK